MLVTSVAFYLGFKKLTNTMEVIEANAEMEDPVSSMNSEMYRKKLLNMMLIFGKYLVCCMFCLTAILKPTVFGAIYYIVFLALLTYWACNQSLGKVFARILICMIPIVYINITVMILYQFQYFQDSKVFDSASIWGRLFNFVDLKTYKDCKDPRLFKFHAHSNATYAIPFCLFFLYQISLVVARQILEAKDGIINLLVVFFHRENQRDAFIRWRKALKKLETKMDEEKTAGTYVMADKIKMLADLILQFIISVSYMISNFIMMVWAITYVGWKGLILLILANVMWLLPFRKKMMIVLSPLLVLSMHFLLLATYLYSMDLTRKELPSKMGLLDVTSGIVIQYKYKLPELLTKSLFGVIIFLSMRQLWQERAIKKQDKELAEAIIGTTSTAATDLGPQTSNIPNIDGFKKKCLVFFATWWISIVVITMIWMDFWSTSNLFRIAFVGLAILFLLTFQLCPFRWWKKFLSIYWWIVITYAMINLLVLYMYQLEETRRELHKYVSEESFQRVGFKLWTDTKQRIMALANPLFFQIAIVIQQNYLQDEFDKLTSPTSPEELTKQKEDLNNSSSKWSQIVTSFHGAKQLVFEILEVHLQNITLLIGWFMCLFDLCAIFIPFVLLFTAACVLGRKCAKIIIYFVSCMVQILIVARLVYMNQYQEHQKWNYVGKYIRNGMHYNVTLNTADWLGLHESQFGRDYADFWQLIWCFGYVLAVTLNRIVTIRMENYRFSRNLQPLQDLVLFPETTYKNCNAGTRNLLKFFVNYGFYKFGCEITIVYASILMTMRMDAVAIPISFWLLIMFALSRKWMRIFWLPGLVVIALLIPIQYMTTLGWWPTFFDRSATRFWNSNDFLLRMQQFCYLMNMAHPPIKAKISLDFILLLIMSCQWHAFKKEFSRRGEDHAAGSNENVCHLIDDSDVINPVPDFITYTKTYLDNYKRALFTGWFYLSLMAVFLAGAMRPTLYSIGYILGAFIFFWEGSELFLRPPNSILFRWNLLITYNILVMTTRTITQIFGCILKYESHIRFNCNVFRLFTIGCVDKYNMTKGVPNVSNVTSCEVSYDALGMGWDCFCFFCLIFQQRIFKSFHFFHIVNNAKAHTILADRGADLIEEQRQSKRQALDNEKIAIENNIKKKWERIKANAEKTKAIRAGNYKFFDQVEKDCDIPLLPPKEDEDSDYESHDPMPLAEYFGLFFFTDMTTVLNITAMRRRRKKAFIRKMDTAERGVATQASEPGTSKDSDTDSGSSKTIKLANVFLFLWNAFESLIVSITRLIDRRTKTFRRILIEINKNRKILKEKTNYTQGVRLGSNRIWQPTQSYKDILNREENQGKDQVVILYSIYMKLLTSIWYLVMAYSEWLCYFMITLNQTLRSHFISLPMPIMAFCWGALTVPKPTKTFWVINIAYLLIMVFLKNFFSMGLAPWEMDSDIEHIFFPPSIIGLQNKNKVLNVIMLICFFFHRVVLQMLGLWKPYNYRTASLINDGEYNFKGGKLVSTDTDKSTKQLAIKSEYVSIGDYFPKSIQHGIAKYAEGFRLYIQQLIYPSSTQIPVDVYTPMFLCDLFNFFLLLFYFGSFQADEKEMGLIEIINNNRVPIAFIVVVLGYVFLMMVDRWFYVRRNRFGKLIFHFIQVIGYHLWFFIINPLITNGQFSEEPIVQTFYVFKCLYFLFSAYQIRNGYPTLISFHYLWHGYTSFHRFGYKLYRIIPYFLEIRCLQDWICCDSCLGIPGWFKMEDITQTLFDQKCQQEFDDKWSRLSGQRMNRTAKYYVGGLLYFLLILTLIFPFLLFSLSSTMGVTTHPHKIEMELFMGNAEPIYQAHASEMDMTVLSENDYQNLSSAFNNIVASEEIFGLFKAEDVLVVKWSLNSMTSWDISPDSKQELLKDLHSNEYIRFRLDIHYTHIGHGGAKNKRTFGQSIGIPPLPNIQRQNLIDIVKSKKGNNNVVWLPLMLPKFLIITKESTPKILSIMEDPGDNVIYHTEEMFANEEDDDEDIPPDPKRLRNILITLNSGYEEWWQLKEECTVEDDNYLYYLKDLVHNDCDGSVVVYLFNEKVFSESMEYMTNSGILGLYLLYFMVIIEVIRNCQEEVGEIWCMNLPNPDKLWRKCMEIYIARDMGYYELEDELFEEIVCILRSRELIIKLTRFEDNNYNPTFVTPGTSKKRI